MSKRGQEDNPYNNNNSKMLAVPYSNTNNPDSELKIQWIKYFNTPGRNMHSHLMTRKGRALLEGVEVLPPPRDSHHDSDHDVIEAHKSTASAIQRVDEFVEHIGAASISEAMEAIAADVEDEASRILVQMYMWAMAMHLDAGQLVESCSSNYKQATVDQVIKTMESIPPRFQSFVNIAEGIAVCSPELKRALEWAKQAVRAYATAVNEIMRAFEYGGNDKGVARTVMSALINAIVRLNAMSARCD